jgi:hypothetical protein
MTDNKGESPVLRADSRAGGRGSGVKIEKRHAFLGKRHVIYGKRHVVYGKRHVVFGKRHVVFGKRRVVFGKRRVIFEKRRVIWSRRGGPTPSLMTLPCVQPKDRGPASITMELEFIA